ncbi:MAG: alpha/beta fold hydrolase [Desulfobacteraceae bacterium]|nr:alpha/beta fold hydrolase [Desulfobacteraceae bacterium]MBC2755445.1 alpha/beta fold hydrolase [Desulfobacteraceae bacterium]
MNPYAYKTVGYAVKALSNLSRANIRTYGEEDIPKGAVIFAVNHFTRMETFFIPYYLNRLTRMTIWALADDKLFGGGLGNLLNRLGAVSTKNPDRDQLMVKSLLTGEASWIIFPEGRMVKSKKIFEKKGEKKGEFMIESPDGSHPPHTGTATLALRTEFYRERLRRMLDKSPEEAERLMALFQIKEVAPVLDHETYIVPVNLTYYPIRARENMLSRMAELFVGELSGRMLEEMMTEGSMLLSGVDVDMRFGKPIRVAQYLKSSAIQADIGSSAPINFDDTIPSVNMMRKTARRIMERYMSAIYQLTTVNHDHIFASLLKYIPDHKIDEQEFRQRAFLATTLCLECMNFFRHDSLMGNQISLLTDDRYDKFNNFINLAIEKGVIRKEDNSVIIDSDFCEESDFHRVRVDNPVVVSANEIEPLTDLQEKLRDLALEHRLRIKYKIKEYLIKKARFDFEKDYANFAIEGESKDRDVGAPFFTKGRDKDIGVVLIHGYMAAPLEVRALAEYLGELGYRIYAPRLKGHGTSPEDLAESTYMEWVESVEEGYVIMDEVCRKVVVGGFSTGAGLALDLASRVKNFAGIFAISPPLKLQDFSARFVPAVNLWNKLMGKLNVESAKKEFVENHPENPHINYVRNPISGIIELDRLMDQIEPKLAEIQAPALVIQSFGDPVVSPEGALKIFKKLGAKNKEYLMVNYERHGIINGEHAERVFRAVGDFLDRLKTTPSQ